MNTINKALRGTVRNLKNEAFAAGASQIVTFQSHDGIALMMTFPGQIGLQPNTYEIEDFSPLTDDDSLPIFQPAKEAP